LSANFFDELQRYTRFGAEDQLALRAFAPVAGAHFARIAEEFYARLSEHPTALAVFEGPAQIERLKGTLQVWMRGLFEGPWDHDYFELRSRIGRVHVQIALPQHFMFGAMNVLRIALMEVVLASQLADAARLRLVQALHKIIDIELAIMLESYREAYVDRVQQQERVERDELQRKLALSEARYQEIVEKAEALIATADSEGRLMLFNAKCEALTGLSRDRARGLRWLDVFVPSTERARVHVQLTAALAGERVPPYEGAVPVVGTRACRVRWHFTTLPGGSAPALCAIGIDVTNEYELAVRTRRAERLAALGTMAAGLAHEIRNPLNAAVLQLSVAERRLGASTPAVEAKSAREALQLAEVEMRRLGGLVQDFLEFAKPHPLRLALADLGAIAGTVGELLGPEAEAVSVALSTHTPNGPVCLELDEEKIKQVLINLVRNAIEASTPGGRITMIAREAGPLAELVVEDDGPGLPLEAPIFEPFFTTKEHGTGLGLAIVHRIVMDHGGHVGVESRPGRTQFQISLPRLPLPA